MEFEWDPNKAASNVSKHKIDFETAVKVFGDAFRYETDEWDDDDVIRFNATGIVEGRVLVVTARLADRHERRRHHEV